MPILILFHTGVRLGELLGLAWEDIDFETNTINISRQVVYISKRGDFFTTLKTESSNRYIIIDDYLVAELKRWKMQQIENENNDCDSYIYIYKTSEGKMVQQSKGIDFPHGQRINLICTRKNGKLIDKNHFTPVLKNNGVNAHSFRHTHATMLIENGATCRTVRSLKYRYNSKSLYT